MASRALPYTNVFAEIVGNPCHAPSGGFIDHFPYREARFASCLRQGQPPLPEPPQRTIESIGLHSQVQELSQDSGLIEMFLLHDSFDFPLELLRNPRGDGHFGHANVAYVVWGKD